MGLRLLPYCCSAGSRCVQNMVHAWILHGERMGPARVGSCGELGLICAVNLSMGNYKFICNVIREASNGVMCLYSYGLNCIFCTDLAVDRHVTVSSTFRRP